MKQKPGFIDQHKDIGKFSFKPIGMVHSPIKEPEMRDWEDVVSEIRIDLKWLKALKGIEDFSHIIVIYYFSRSKKGVKLQTHPKGREDLPLVGLFSTRSPHRPNPIGLTICRLIGRKGSKLKVKGLDAIDGTPIIDIKPYIPDNDLVKRARGPWWIKKL